MPVKLVYLLFDDERNLQAQASKIFLIQTKRENMTCLDLTCMSISPKEPQQRSLVTSTLLMRIFRFFLFSRYLLAITCLFLPRSPLSAWLAHSHQQGTACLLHSLLFEKEEEETKFLQAYERTLPGEILDLNELFRDLQATLSSHLLVFLSRSQR